MASNLVIVESPAKAKTIEKFLGKDFKVASSYGHIADLPSNELGVDVDKDFSPKYIVSSDKKKVVSELKSLAKKMKTVWLASDEDREGEAIAWHLANTLDLKSDNTKRIVFNEITKTAILDAIENPRDINYNLVNAQQARRVLDRLVGYELSPVLWRKVKGGLSAGRVQSVSVRLIVEREREINAFVPQQTFKIQAIFSTQQNKSINALLPKTFDSSETTEAFLHLNKSATFKIDAIEKKPASKSPTAPFTTSTLQQEAARKLYFSVSKTMNMAQRLYEAGLITYMRTDSVNLSKEAQQSALKQIEKHYGEAYKKPRKYKVKSKGAQEAHEAIRPTDFSKAKVNLDYDQSRLYELIWKRAIASQMSDAKLERTQLKIAASTHSDKFVAKGEVIKFDGFLKIYLEGVDEESDEQNELLPAVKEGEVLNLKSMEANQRFSRPPYRFTEASLVKKLEELGIGRPSTYAPTISTIQNRKYVEKGTSEGEYRSYTQLQLVENEVISKSLKERTGANKGKLIPTDVGVIVNDFLVANFNNILDYSFTAKVEESFDQIADGSENWTSMIKGFYDGFHKTVDFVKENAARESGERVLGNDPKSGRVVKVRLGRFGPIAQIGEPEDEEKPIFVSLAPGQQLESLELEEALELFKLPKSIGSYEDQEVTVNNGRFGPYIKFKDIFVSLPVGEDPMSVELDRAILLIKEKLAADAPIYTFDKLPVTKGKGRFGPFLKWNGLFINVNKKYDFDNLSEEEIETLIKEKIQKEKDKLIKEWPEEAIRIEKARWGRSNIIKGSKKIELGKDIDPTKITLEAAIQYLKPKTAKKKK
ncbi:type I DNA topoisomerase [Flavobacteriaceae bacterium]|nr:type I DNA topoisomerase [Flavobacteriaceae bacterium]MDA8762615.1 type I DNA topoisomerase [Flavobacteriaceae bacterium]